MTRRQAAATTATRKSRQVEAMKGIKYMKKKKDSLTGLQVATFPS